jgi:hypothetical protein
MRLFPVFLALAACSTSADDTQGTPVPHGASPGTDAGAAPDAPAEAAAQDAAPPPPDATSDAAPAKAPIFVAQGSLGRTTISCDDGKTWAANHSWDIDADPL